MPTSQEQQQEAEDEARISTGTEKLQREVSEAKSCLEMALGSMSQKSLSGSLIPGVLGEVGLHSFPWKKWPTSPPALKLQPGIPLSTSQTGKEKRQGGRKRKSAKRAQYFGELLQPKKRLKASLVTVKTTV